MKRKFLFIFYGIILLTFVSRSSVYSQQIFKTTQTSVIPYLEYLPKDYELNSDKYPVVIFLHGIGERGIITIDLTILSESIQSVTKIGPPMHVKNGNQFPFILISPQLKNNFGTWPTDYVMEVINYVKTYLRIDEKRIYLTGLSLGGGGAWKTAQDYPELFAALAPVCGGSNTPSMACGIASENLPVWAFHGDMDMIVPISRSINMVNAINNCVPAPDPMAKMTIYPGVGHDAWTKAYKTDHSIHDPNVYEWMLSHTNTINAGNKLPTANAGADKTLSGTSTSIVGSGSDPDGNISAYLWTQLSGPTNAILENKTTPSLYASDLKPGEYVFSFRVTDNGGASDTDYIKVKIDNNILPVANAGPDTTIYLPANSIKITGTGTDADGVISAYAWSKISGPSAATLTGANSATVTTSNLLAGTYVFRLTVTDDKGEEDYDDMTLFVKEPVAPPVAPIANAGVDKLVILPVNEVDISGSATDVDGTIASYQWTQKSGPACTMSHATTPSLNVSGLVSGTYEFRLTATDNTGLKNYDDVVVNVTFPPLVDAGADKSVNLPVTSVLLTGSASDPDGTIKNYTWSKYSGPSATLVDTLTSSLTITDLKEGTYVFMLKVSDNLTAEATDYATVNVKNEILSTSPSSTILKGMTSLDLENCLVTIFNDTGDRIFSGVWTLEKYNEIFSQNGLYIYHIMKEGRRIDTGKIYIRR